MVAERGKENYDMLNKSTFDQCFIALNYCDFFFNPLVYFQVNKGQTMDIFF